MDKNCSLLARPNHASRGLIFFLWIPIQVKSNENDASQFIPNKGFATFPYGNTFKLISKIGKNNDQRNLEDLCEPLGKPVEKKPVSKIPANVDYAGHMGWDKESEK